MNGGMFNQQQQQIQKQQQQNDIFILKNKIAELSQNLGKEIQNNQVNH